MPLAEGGPKERRVGLNVVDLGRQLLREVAVKILRHDGRQGNVTGLAAFHRHVTETPPAVQRLRTRSVATDSRRIPE
jgi:hypothetical protein